MGNTLLWKEMLPFVDPKKGVANALPETFGTTWRSPLNVQKIHGHVEAAWNIYKRSHDRDYLAQIYAFYRGLYGQQLDGEYGLGAEVARTLRDMAVELGESEDVPLWSRWLKDHTDRIDNS